MLHCSTDHFLLVQDFQLFSAVKRPSSDMKSLIQATDVFIPGAARLGCRPTGVAHSKITRVRVLSWPLLVLTSLYFLTVTKSCHTQVSNQFKAIKKIFLSTVVITKNYMSNRCFP